MLTQADISSLPASRELDALVAERVMGWHALRDGHCAECEAMIKEGTLMMSDPQGLVGVVPDYSTSISAAWEVVEKTRLFDNAHLRRDLWNEIRWQIVAEPSEEILASADTAPLAICRAVLKTVEAA